MSDELEYKQFMRCSYERSKLKAEKRTVVMFRRHYCLSFDNWRVNFVLVICEQVMDVFRRGRTHQEHNEHKAHSHFCQQLSHQDVICAKIRTITMPNYGYCIGIHNDNI